MRILNITFKNINSLEGEGRINFEQGPLADAGVFAITGPNGSGKTSILDVITLSLYGETFRFDKPAGHVMTKQTTECYAQIEFALGEDKFRSSWQVKTDASLDYALPVVPNMQLSRLNGHEEILADTPNQVRLRIAELTGMDFHRFTKSIVLPQGDFAAFLNALDSERMDILEKISGSQLYTSQRQHAEQQASSAQNLLTQLQQDIAGLPLLDENSLEAAEQDLQDFKDQAEELKTQQTQIKQQLTDKQHIVSLEQQQAQLYTRRQSLLTKIAGHQQDLEHIAAGQTATAFRIEIGLLDSKQGQIDQNQSSLDSYRKELSQLQQQLGSNSQPPSELPDKSLAEQQQNIDSLKLSLSELKLDLPRQREIAQGIQQQIVNNQTALGELDAWLTAHQADAVLVSDFPDVVRLRNLRGQLQDLASKQKASTSWKKNTESALKKNKAALETTQTDIADLKAQIEADSVTLQEISQGKSLDELKELLQEQQARVNDLQEMYSLAGVTAKLTDKGWFAWLGLKKQSDIPPNIPELQARFDALSEELEREQNIIKVLEQALRNEALTKKMSVDRSKLVDNQPCYLCGSLNHPYVSKPPVFTDARKALVDQRSKIQGLKSHAEHAASQLKSAQKFDSKLSAKQQRLLQMHSQWTSLANRLNVMRGGLDIGNLSLQKQFLQEETEELNRIRELIKRFSQLHRGIAKMNGEIDSKQTALSKLNTVVADLTTQWNNRPPELDEIEKTHAERLAEQHALTEKLTAQLAALGEKLPARGKEDALFDRLNSRRQDYQVYQLRQQGIQNEINQLHEKLQACENAIDANRQQHEAKLQALSEQEQLTLHLAVIEKQKLIVEQEQQLRVSQIEHRTILQTITDKLAGSSFASVEELRAQLHLIAQEASIKQQLDSEQSGVAQIDQQLQACQAQLAAEKANASELDISDIEQTLADIAGKIDITEQEIAGLQNKLNKQLQYRNKSQTLQTQAEQQQALLTEAEAELKLMDADPVAFKRKIQQQLADKLLSQTNQILNSLSGRYSLRSAASELGLALEIEDNKRNNVRRSPQTLSGGESFVVSLALALALADIANNGKAIDSLFLDEGFGNLDAESLYMAMSTLEGLKIHGKTVGIISHVDGVKKRIKTQIELVKKPNGLSELRLVA